jgi:hypothetical protein
VDAQAVPWNKIRPLESVTETPLLRPNGTILQEPGYDVETGILFEPAAAFQPIPEHPSRDDALGARDELLEVVCDFPFAAPMHRAAWLASVLTPLARPAFPGPAPLFLTIANIRGCGKGLSASSVSVITTGRPFAMSTYAHDPVEMRKVITSIAASGEPLILFDNVSGPFGNSALDAALTTTEWTDRLLGTNDKPRLPLNPTWYATGNNCLIEADTARRVCPICFDSREENPEEREGFAHPDLMSWVKLERMRLLRAALTILRAYCAAGRPQARLKPWGSFEDWSNLVRQCVVWLGLPDPAGTRVSLAEESDRDINTLRVLMSVWKAVVGSGAATTATALKALEQPENESQRDGLLTVLSGPKGEKPTSRQLGNALRRYKRRVLGGCCFDGEPNRTGVLEWKLIEGGAG